MTYVYFSVKNGQYQCVIVENNKPSKTIQDSRLIARSIVALKSDVTRVLVSRGTLKMYMRDGNVAILEDYSKALETTVYQPVIEILKSSTIEIAIHPRKSAAPTLLNKVQNLNKRRIAALGLSIVLSLSFLGSTIKSDYDMAEKAVATEKKVVEDLIVQPRISIPRVSEEMRAWNSWIKNMDLATRFQQTEGYQAVEEYDGSTITLGTRVDRAYIENFINSEAGQYLFQVCQVYGVDPYLLIAISMTESRLDHAATIPGGWAYRENAAVGITQQQRPGPDKFISAWNYQTGQTDTVAITMENACDIMKNIQMGAMVLQKSLRAMNYNLYLTIQSYNFGSETVSMLINIRAEELNPQLYESSRDQARMYAVKNIPITEWVAMFQDISKNPQNYFRNCSYSRYGNGNYIAEVMSFYIGTYSVNKMEDNKDIVVNMDTMETEIRDLMGEYQQALLTEQLDFKKDTYIVKEKPIESHSIKR